MIIKKYKCVKDLQGSEYCVGETRTDTEWRDFFIKELDKDFHDLIIKELKKMKGAKLMKYISNIWDLEFKEVK